MVPLALALPVGDVRYHLAQADKRDKAFVVTGPCQRTVTLPIEPQVHSTDFVGGWLHCIPDNHVCQILM